MYQGNATSPKAAPAEGVLIKPSDSSAGDVRSSPRGTLQRSLALAQKHELRSIAFPSISTGIYGFPVERAAPIALRAIRDFLDRQATSSIQRVSIVCFDEVTYESFRVAAAEVV